MNFYSNSLIILDSEKIHKNNNTKLSNSSITSYFAGVRSYLETYDIDIKPRKLKVRVTLPKIYKRRPQPINDKDIQPILNSCSNVRLKVFILVLASSGMRSREALSLRNIDIDFSQSPTIIHIRAETSKTAQDRDVYISDEATKELKKFVESKYQYQDKVNEIKKKWPNHLVFTNQKSDSINPTQLHRRLHINFGIVLKKVEMDQRKDGQGTQRRKISFHSFRRFVKTQISKHAGSDYSEYILGHVNIKMDYYGDKEDAAPELYKKCMKYLTFLDPRLAESVSEDFESKLKERDQEVTNLNQRDLQRERELHELTNDMEEMKKYYADSTEHYRKQIDMLQEQMSLNLRREIDKLESSKKKPKK